MTDAAHTLKPEYGESVCLSGHIRFGGQGWSPWGGALVLSLCHTGLQNIFGAASCIQGSLDTIGSCTWLHPRDGRSCIIYHFCTQNLGMREAHLLFFQTLQLLSDVLFCFCFFSWKKRWSQPSVFFCTYPRSICHFLLDPNVPPSMVRHNISAAPALIPATWCHMHHKITRRGTCQNGIHKIRERKENDLSKWTIIYPPTPTQLRKSSYLIFHWSKIWKKSFDIKQHHILTTLYCTTPALDFTGIDELQQWWVSQYEKWSRLQRGKRTTRTDTLFCLLKRMGEPDKWRWWAGLKCPSSSSSNSLVNILMLLLITAAIIN